MNEFVYGDQDNVDKMIDMARTHRAVVFDLRGNGGGSVDIQRYIIGRFVSQDLNYGMMKGRRKTDSLVAHAAKDPLKSMLVILIDGGSASSSEMTAYALQAQGRAIVVGDRSMGAVMTANIRGHEVGGVERKMPYQMEITIADVVMADGTRLENRGVTPDELVVPTSADLAAKRDPALARALAIAGVTRTPEDAWRIVHGGGDSKDR
jgi:carboxyl-terminal processing protease